MDCWDLVPSPAWTRRALGAVCAIPVRTWLGTAASAGLYCTAHPSLHKPDEELQLPCPLEAPTKAQGVCARVQCPMATPPRGWLNPAEPQGIGMTQLQFWAPKKEVQGSGWAQFISRSASDSGHYAPPLQEQFCCGFQERGECVCSRRAGSAGFSPVPEPDVRLDHVSNFQVP